MPIVNSPESAQPPAPAKPRVFGRAFWILNSIEMWERLAFYNLRVMAPIYIMQADNPGGLHLTAGDKGTIYAWWAVFQSRSEERRLGKVCYAVFAAGASQESEL